MAKTTLTEAQKAIGGRLGKTEHKCNILNNTFRALVDCEGRTRVWKYEIGTFGRREAAYVCPACAEVKLNGSRMTRPEWSDYVTELEGRKAEVLGS